MNGDPWQDLVDQLRGTEYQFGLILPSSPVHRVDFDPGLADAEIAESESRFGFRFLPDLRELLQTALPRCPDFTTGGQVTKRSSEAG